MAEERPEDPSGHERQLQLLRELADLVRAQGRRQQAAEAEARRLRAAIEGAAGRLGAMLGVERASRAALRAVVDDLRAALDGDGPVEGPPGDPAG